MHMKIKLLCTQSVKEKLQTDGREFAGYGRQSNTGRVSLVGTHPTGVSLTSTLCQQLLFTPL